MKNLIIYGCGGLGRVIEQIVFDINQDNIRWNLLGFIDDNENKHHTTIAGYPVLGSLENLDRKFDGFFVMGLASPRQRIKSVKTIISIGFKNFATLIHPSTWISRRVRIGEGSIIYPGVHIDVDVTIGKHNIFNKLCTIGHDSRFEDFVTAAPGVNFGGNIHVGQGCEFGINSSTVQGISIGEWSTIGAGAAVVHDLPPRTTSVGTPAKPLKYQP